MFGPICSSCLEFYLFFCPATEGEELIFQKRKKNRCLIPEDSFPLFLGCQTFLKYSVQKVFTPIQNCGAQDIKMRDVRDLIFHGQWRKPHGENTRVTNSDSQNRMVNSCLAWLEPSEGKMTLEMPGVPCFVTM